MRLAFVTDNGFSMKNGKYYYSGGNIQHYNTVTKFFDDIIFVARNNLYDPSSNQISEEYKVILIDSISDIRKFPKNFICLDKVLDNVVQKSDVIMCFGLNGYFAHKKAIKYKKPTIVYVGGCVYDTLKNMDSNFKKILAPVMMAMVKDMVKNATYTHYVDDYLLESYPTKGKYLICPSARIDIDIKSIERRKKKIKKQSQRKIIGLIGYTNNKIKGIDTAIKALQLLDSSYKLQIVGRGDHVWLDNLAKKLGVQDRVEFLGVLSGRDNIFNWLDDIDIYIQPSRTEGMPRATIEAMSRGCPVVSSDVGGLKKIIDNKYQIKAGDYIDLSKKIKRLGENPILMKEEAIKNFKTAQNFDFELLDLKRDSFYRMIIGNLEDVF